jgi:hypothetical protein
MFLFPGEIGGRLFLPIGWLLKLQRAYCMARPYGSVRGLHQVA